jgi:hypothetical protein
VFVRPGFGALVRWVCGPRPARRRASFAPPRTACTA